MDNFSLKRLITEKLLGFTFWRSVFNIALGTLGFNKLDHTFFGDTDASSNANASKF